MRKTLVAVLASIAILGAPLAAFAGTVSLVWAAGVGGGTITGLGSSTVFVGGTAVATLSLDIVVDVGTEGLLAGGIDIEFDTDLGDELNILSFTELGWTNAKSSRNLLNITQGIVSSLESAGGNEGQVFGLEAFTLASGPQNTTLTFARIVFVTNPSNVATDGADVFETSERDATLFADLQTPTGTFPLPGPATVNLPEPASYAMIALAAGCLFGARRRS